MQVPRIGSRHKSLNSELLQVLGGSIDILVTCTACQHQLGHLSMNEAHFHAAKLCACTPHLCLTG